MGLPGIGERHKSTRARFNLDVTPISQNIGIGNVKRQLHNIFKHTVTTIHAVQSGIPIKEDIVKQRTLMAEYLEVHHKF